jgi:hypothetical protein
MQTYDAEFYLLDGTDAEGAAELIGLDVSTSDAECAQLADDLAAVCRQDGIRLTHARRAVRHLRSLLRAQLEGAQA